MYLESRSSAVAAAKDGAPYTPCGHSLTGLSVLWQLGCFHRADMTTFCGSRQTQIVQHKGAKYCVSKACCYKYGATGWSFVPAWDSHCGHTLCVHVHSAWSTNTNLPTLLDSPLCRHRFHVSHRPFIMRLVVLVNTIGPLLARNMLW